MFIYFLRFLLKTHFLPANFIIINFYYVLSFYCLSLTYQLIFVNFSQFLLQTGLDLDHFLIWFKLFIVSFFVNSPFRQIIINFKLFLLKIISLILIRWNYYFFVQILFYFILQNQLISKYFAKSLHQIGFDLNYYYLFIFGLSFFLSFRSIIINF